MSVQRIVYGVLGVLAAVIFVPQMCSSRERASRVEYNYEQYARHNEGRIRDALIEQLSQRFNPACVRTVRFPWDSGVDAGHCDLCDTLVDAGLLERSAGTGVRYDLSPTGRPLYSEDLTDGARGVPGLCFGRQVLDEMELSVPAQMQAPSVSVRFSVRIDQPHDILFGPHARALGLPQFTRTQIGGTRLPNEHRCASLDAQGAFLSLSGC